MYRFPFPNPTPKLTSDLNKSLNNINSLKHEIHYLTKELNNLKLLTRAIWEIVSTKLDIDEKELFEKFNEIDLRDGVKDKKYENIFECKECKRKISTKFDKCIYCGTELEKKSAFD